jgi:hypothetical protein
MKPPLIPSSLLAAAVLALTLTPAVVAQPVLQPLWSLAPVNDTTFPDTSNLTRGGGYNSATGNFLVVTRAGGTAVEVLDGATGAVRGQLNTTGIAGGTFALNMIDVAADGAIYAANLTTDSSTNPFRIYRWASESAVPTLAYSGNPLGAGVGRFGDDFRVRGSGKETQIVVGSGTGAGRNSSVVGVFQTTDGAVFTGSALPITGMSAGDTRLGLDFGPGDTLFAKQAGALRQISLNGASGQVTASYALGVAHNGGTTAPFAFSPDGTLLVAYAFGTLDGQNQSVNLYSVASLVPGKTTAAIDQELLGTKNGNASGVGAVDFSADGATVFVVTPQNGISAYRVTPEPGTWALFLCGAGLLGFWRRHR